MFVTNWNSTTKIQKISEITNFFRHYFLSRTEVSVYKAFLKDRLSFRLFIYDLFGTDNIHMNAHFGKMKDMIVDIQSKSKVSLTIRYKFNTTRSKYKGTGAGESQKNRM